MSLIDRVKDHHKDNPYSVKREDIEELLDTSLTNETMHFNKVLIISWELPNGFTITGRSAVVNPEKFDYKIGLQLCREEAIKQLYTLLGFLVQDTMHKDIEADEANITTQLLDNT